MPAGIMPRAQYLTAQLRREEQAPLSFDPGLIERLPGEVKAATGPIRSVQMPQQGVCNLALMVEAEHGTFLLKVAQGEYRSQELWAEHTVMQALNAGAVPVPKSIAFGRQGALAFQLREYIEGEPLGAVLHADEAIRPVAIRQMGETLAAIHAVHPGGEWTWDQWLESSLARAADNLVTRVYDPDDFAPERPPEVVFEWLKANRPPSGGDLCLLHGDYRPKNLLWRENRVVSVIDWAFVDVGDPYYDLSIFRWYMRDQAEWDLFLAAYGLTAFDQERFRYSMALHKFLNV